MLDADATLAALAPWREVAGAADAYFHRVLTTHPALMQCGPGCHECCQAGLGVLTSEALGIVLALQRLDPDLLDRLQARARTGDLTPGQPTCCDLLRDDGLCAVYDLRPVLCRTHGLPILQDGGVGWCRLNFPDGPPDGAVLNGGLLMARLTVADALVRERSPLPLPAPSRETSRIPVRQLLLEGAAALPRLDGAPRG